MKSRWLQAVGATFVLLLMSTIAPTDELGATPRSCNLKTATIGSAGGFGTASTCAVRSALGQPTPVGDGMAAGSVLYAGLCAAAWTPVPVRLALQQTCWIGPTMIPAFTTIPRITLTGFSVENQSSISLCIAYHLTSDGPATLSDEGHAAALSGWTSPLAPGQSFLFPDAALLIPEIREYARQNVTYRTFAVGGLNLEDSCTTLIEFTPPVPVLIQKFAARVLDDAVALSWELESDEAIRGFKLYRHTGCCTGEIVHSNALIAADARQYVDASVRAGTSYDYTLFAVAEDGSELRSQTLTVRTRVRTLTLHQNYPNPFNPTTTISFELPQRARVVVAIFDVAGRLVKTLVDGVVDEGLIELKWDGTDESHDPVGSGVYLCQLRTGKNVLTKKLVLLK